MAFHRRSSLHYVRIHPRQAMRPITFLLAFCFSTVSVQAQATIQDIYDFLLSYGTDNGSYDATYYSGILVRTQAGQPMEVTGAVTQGAGDWNVGFRTNQNTVKLEQGGIYNTVQLDQNGTKNQIQIAQDGTKNNVKSIAGSVTTVDNTMANAVWVRWEDCAMSVRICQEGSEQPLRTTYDTSGETPFYPDEQTKDRSEEILGPYDSITSGNNATEETLATMHDVTEHVSGGLAMIGSLSGTPVNPPSVSTSVNSPTVQLNLRRGTQISVGYSWSRITGIAGVIRQLLVGIVGWFTYWSAKTMIVGALVGTKMSEEARKVRATSSNPFAWQPPF